LAGQAEADRIERPQPIPESWTERDAGGMMIGPRPGESATPGQINTFEILRAMDFSTIGQPFSETE